MARLPSPMKTSLLLGAFLALGLTGFGRDNTDKPVVILYEQANFQGGWLVLPAGDDLAEVRELYFSNGHRLEGNVGSIELGRGVGATLSGEPGFRGVALQLRTSLPQLREVESGGIRQNWAGFQSLHTTFDREEWYRTPVVVVAAPPPPPDPDVIILRTYREILGRSPSEQDFRIYRQRVRQFGWDERMLGEDIRHGEEYRGPVVGRMIERAYREILGRPAGPRDLEHYRHEIFDRGMTEEGLRRDLRHSEEFRGPVVNRMIARAYHDILGREPDAAGLDHYRNQLIDKGMTEERMREDLSRSDEARRRRH